MGQVFCHCGYTIMLLCNVQVLREMNLGWLEADFLYADYHSVHGSRGRLKWG